MLLNFGIVSGGAVAAAAAAQLYFIFDIESCLFSGSSLSLVFVIFFNEMKRSKSFDTLVRSTHSIDRIVSRMHLSLLASERARERKEKKAIKESGLVFFIWYFFLLLLRFDLFSIILHFQDFQILFIVENREKEIARQRNEKLRTRKLLLSILLL